MDVNSTTNDMIEGPAQFFGWLDFTLFLMMLGVSTIIGIYFGFWGKKENTPKEYLHGGKTMSILPVSVSLVTSVLSGVAMMGTPTEIYRFGTLYWNVISGCVISGIINYYFYLPVFYGLQITSTYEYLEMRFSHRVRVMASALYTIGLLLYVPIVVYVPALVLSQVSGVNLHFITVGTSVICVFYTMLGGLKAVVWTDFLQGFVMFFSSVAIIILGVNYAGGFGAVWQRNEEGGRIKFFDMDPNPFIRLSFWSVTIGSGINWLSVIAVNQSMVQKFMSVPTLRDSKRSLILCTVGIMLIKSIVCYIGLLIYHAYYNCDPIQSKVVTRPDQLATYYVMNIIAPSMPGLAGLFVAGVFSAALSSMSGCLNSLGATLFEDFVRPRIDKSVSDATINKIIKCVVIIVGAICLSFVFIVDKFGNILQLTISVLGVTSGAMLGLFTFGMFFPRGNTQGVLAGSITSLLLTSWIIYKAQEAIANGSSKMPLLPTSIEGCSFNATTSVPNIANETLGNEVVREEAFILYRISFMYYTLMGLLITIIVGAIVSYFTEPPPPEKLNPALFTPFVRKYLKTPEKMNNNPETKELIKIQSTM